MAEEEFVSTEQIYIQKAMHVKCGKLYRSYRNCLCPNTYQLRMAEKRRDEQEGELAQGGQHGANAGGKIKTLADVFSVRDLFFKIMNLLCPRCIANVGVVDKSTEELVKDDTLWKNLLSRDLKLDFGVLSDELKPTHPLKAIYLTCFDGTSVKFPATMRAQPVERAGTFFVEGTSALMGYYSRTEEGVVSLKDEREVSPMKKGIWIADLVLSGCKICISERSRWNQHVHQLVARHIELPLNESYKEAIWEFEQLYQRAENFENDGMEMVLGIYEPTEETSVIIQELAAPASFTYLGTIDHGCYYVSKASEHCLIEFSVMRDESGDVVALRLPCHCGKTRYHQ